MRVMVLMWGYLLVLSLVRLSHFPDDARWRANAYPTPVLFSLVNDLARNAETFKRLWHAAIYPDDVDNGANFFG